MNGRFLLDTNIVIALFRNETPVLSQLEVASAVFVPAIVLGELYYGARKSAHVEVNLTRLDEFADASNVVVCDGITAQHYGMIKNRLRELGRPIPENDIWIAALAVQHAIALASRDEHFREIESVTLEAW